MIRTALFLMALTLVVTACNQNNQFGTSGDCCPTVAGKDGGGKQYGSYQEARDVFTRQSKDGVLTATLKDASWLKYEGPAEEVMKRHRDYFEFIYTSFVVTLRVKDFTNPKAETFVLEDSTGGRVAGRPVTYEASMIPVDDRHQFTFNLAFQHQMTSDMQWVRLTRMLDGESVEWSR